MSASLMTWAWIFLIAYIAVMIAIGIYAGRQVHSGDDYAVARSSYGPLMLALAFAATTASGATFIGIPGLGYSLGVASLWYPFLYPIGVYIGVLLCLKAVAREGELFGSRSIPEFLGERYESDFIRLALAIFSLILLFYLAGQLVAGLVMFEQILGLPKAYALALTTVVLLIYVSIGGAHADIITDGVQGFMMLGIALLVIYLFMRGVNIDGEWHATVDVLKANDPSLVTPLKPGNALFGSPWTIALMVIAHIPLGMLPHIGNKIWALNGDADRRRFLLLAFCFAMILPCMALGGLLARAVLGDELLQSGLSPNESIPALFIEIMPAWFAALLSVAIISAIMSTADGLVISASQVFANDIYRLSIVPRWRPHLSQAAVDRQVLNISRYATVVVLIGSSFMAWALLEVNIALIVWIGIGGMTSALAGPLVLGSQWSGVNKSGAIAGMLGGAATFCLLHTGLLTSLLDLSSSSWLAVQSSNAFTCSGIGVIVSITFAILFSLMTQRAEHAAD